MLEFERSRPRRSFVVYVWVDVSAVLGMKAIRLSGQDVCINGQITRELNNPVVHVTIPHQIIEAQIGE